MLSESAEDFTRRYKRRSQGYNFEKVVARVSSLLQLEKNYITGRGRHRDRVRARDLVCYWSANELGISMAEWAERFGLSLAAVSYAAKRGEEVANKDGYRRR